MVDVEELNEEYIEVINQMRVLNAKRKEIFDKYKDINPEAEPVIMITPTYYHDLFGNDLDKK
jgi:uncharacterized coiled-coil DUF342 family protein